MMNGNFITLSSNDDKNGSKSQGYILNDAAQTLVAPCEDLVRRSDSISYFKTLKHSSRSSKNRAYVLTHAEQSQAA